MVWPDRPITRPTSPRRSCNLKVIVLPLGISVSTMSSGNSISSRMMNSRNSRIGQQTNHECGFAQQLRRDELTLLHEFPVAYGAGGSVLVLSVSMGAGVDPLRSGHYGRQTAELSFRPHLGAVSRLRPALNSRLQMPARQQPPFFAS